MLLIDGVKYELWTPPSENEFEKLVEKHAEDIFGKDAKYFDLKHKLASRSGTGSIPDGYVITFGDKPKVQIIEFELESHSLQHIVSQVVNIINGIANSTTQQKICNAIEDGINEDDIFTVKITKAIKPVSIQGFLSDNFSNALPIINIIIDRSWASLEEAVNKINPTPKIIEFRTFSREGVGLSVHAHIFEPLYRMVVPKVEGPISPIQTSQKLPYTLTNPDLKYMRFRIPKKEKGFFPPPKTEFDLLIDESTFRTNCAGTTAVRIRKNLRPWFINHRNDVKPGDKVIFTMLEPMKTYSLEIVK